MRNGVNKTLAKNSPVPVVAEPLTFDEVQFEVDGQCVRININETLEVTAKEKNGEEEVKTDSELRNKGCFLFCFVLFCLRNNEFFRSSD